MSPFMDGTGQLQAFNQALQQHHGAYTAYLIINAFNDKERKA
jgi:hypothetical protein